MSRVTIEIEALDYLLEISRRYIWLTDRVKRVPWLFPRLLGYKIKLKDEQRTSAHVNFLVGLAMADDARATLSTTSVETPERPVG